MNKKLIGVFAIAIFVLSVMLTANPVGACKNKDCKDDEVQVTDKVDFGVSSSEAGHNLKSWGPAILGTRAAWSPYTGDKDKSGYLDYGVPSSQCITTTSEEYTAHINVIKITIDGVEQQGQGIGSPYQTAPPDTYRDVLLRVWVFNEKNIEIRGTIVHYHVSDELAAPRVLTLRAIDVPFTVTINGILVLTNTHTGYDVDEFSAILPTSLQGATVLDVKVTATGKLLPALALFVDWIKIDYCEGCTVED